MNLRNVGDSKFTACHTNFSGDVLALEAHGLYPVGSSRSKKDEKAGDSKPSASDKKDESKDAEKSDK